MTQWVVLLAVVLYLVGVFSTYRVRYTAAVDKLHRARMACVSCKSNVDYFRKYGDNSLVCVRHDTAFFDYPLWSGPLVTAIFWLPIGVGYGTFTGIKWIVKRTVFPRGVRTPAKTEWETLVQEARIERNQKKIEQEKRKLV